MIELLKNYVIHYRMLKFPVGLGMIVDKVHEVNSFKEGKRLEKHKSLKTKTEMNQGKFLKRTPNKLLNNAFYWKTMKNLRNGLQKNC